MRKKSEELFRKAVQYIPGGVNSPARSARAAGIEPPFISKAKGYILQDADGNEYVDYVCSWGPMILGHAHPEVTQTLLETVPLGTSYGAPTELENEMARTIVEMVPSVEMVRMVNSGTEATMSAIRLARAYTGREKIIKFDGCYHGHVDSLLVSAGSGVATLGIPGTPGIPRNLANHTISLPFNNPEEVDKAFDKWSPEVAAIIVEPVPGNMGVIEPDLEFLKKLREISRIHGSLLIFDEIISGFRVAPGGAQELYGITPDLTCLGKIIGGGMPVGAYGGPREIMARVAPQGEVYQAGTLSGNPLAMAAGLATLNVLRKGDIYASLEKKSKTLFSGLRDAAQRAGIEVTLNRVGSMGTLFFTKGPVHDFASACTGDEELFRRYFTGMLEQGIYLAPSPFEATFLSDAHTHEVISKTIDCAKGVFHSL